MGQSRSQSIGWIDDTETAPPRYSGNCLGTPDLFEHTEMIAAMTTISASTAIPTRRLHPVAIAPMIGGPASIPV